MVNARVGRSLHTPPKHKLLDLILGKVCGVLACDSDKVPCRITWRHPLVMVDLCGGDGLSNDDHDSSPAIMYKHCQWLAKRGKRTKLEVLEKMEATFEQLEQNCEAMSKEIVTLTNGDSSKYRLPVLDEKQPAFVHCDPNTVDQIPLSEEFLAGFNRYTTYLVTLGCNAGGLKRLPDRSKWFDYVEMVIKVLPKHHDVVLLWLNRDASQWAYLLSLPSRWQQDFTEVAVKKMSDLWPNGVSAVSYRRDKKSFNRQVARLFLTKEEYASKYQ